MPDMFKIVHYRSKCIGCNLCYEWQPELWRMSKKDGKATLLHAELKNQTFVLQVGEPYRETTERLVRECPVKIIQIA